MLKVLDFYADWCAPCQALGPTLAEIAALDVPVERIDADCHPDICERYGVQGLPTLVVLRDGAPVDVIAGSNCLDKTAVVRRVWAHRAVSA